MAGKNFVDPLLSNIAKGYRPKGHINEQVMPVLPVNKPTAKIADYGGQNLRIVSTIKSPEGGTPVVTMNVSQASSYVLEEHSLKAMASDKAAENQDKPFDEQKDKAELVTDLLSVAREYGLANFMNTVGNFTNATTLSGTGQWGGSADDPLGNLQTAIGTVADAMNVPEEEVSLVLSRDSFRKLVFLSEIKELLGHRYEGFKKVKPEELAAALGIRQVLVAWGRYNTAADGQTDTFGNLWGKHAWAVYIPSKPELKEHCFGYTVKRRSGIEVDKWYDNDVKGWWVRATDEYDQYVLNEKGVYMIKDAVA